MFRCTLHLHCHITVQNTNLTSPHVANMVLSIVNLIIVGGTGTSLDHTFCQPRNWSTHSTSLSEAMPDSSHKHSSSALVSSRDPTKAQRVDIPEEATTLTWLSQICKYYTSGKSMHTCAQQYSLHILYHMNISTPHYLLKWSQMINQSTNTQY